MSCAWFEKDPKESDAETDKRRRAISLIAECRRIEERQSAWYELNMWNATVYNNRVLAGFRWGADEDMTAELSPANLRTENIVGSVGQAMLSKASSSPLKPTLVPHYSSWKTARAVREADRFLFGAWRATKAEDVAINMFNDAYTCGLGCAQVAFDGKALHVESVFYDNVVIDNTECANRTAPRTYYIRKMVQRRVVEALYGCTIDDPTEGGKKTYRYRDKRMQGRDWVPLVEVFRLPDAKGEGGVHNVACLDKMLIDNTWDKPFVPLVFFWWQDRQSGFFCKSGVEEVLPYQVKQDELNDDIYEAQRLGCRLKILAHTNSNIDANDWRNENGLVVQYSGTEPKPFETKTNLTELYNERERNRATAFFAMGLSEAFAGAEPEQGNRLDSSAAIREQANREDTRHLRLWTNFQTARLQLARTMLLVLANSEGADNYHAGAAIYGNKVATKKIPYKSIKHLTEDEYTWTLEPVSMGMMSPAARRESLRDNVSRGQSQMGSEDAKRIESNPDIEMIEDLELANREDIGRIIGLMEDGEYEKPDEFVALSMGMLLVNANMKRLLQFQDVKRTDLKIQLHKRWLTDAGALIVNAKKMQQQQMMAEQQAQMTPFQPTQGMAGTSAAVTQ